MKNIEDWIEENLLNCKRISDKIIEVEEVGEFFLVNPKESKIFNSEFHLNVNNIEEKFVKDNNIPYYLFYFGGNYYFSSTENKKEVSFNLFKYLGRAKTEIDTDFPYYGIRGKYELLNGSRNYKDWIKKAKFYGYSTLGICEKNSLAGILQFNLDCERRGVKPISGMTFSLKLKGVFYDCKIYSLTEEGWKNLLKLNKFINVDFEGEIPFVEEEFLLGLGKGNVFIFNPFYPLSLEKISEYKKSFDAIYYQIDAVEYDNNDTDKNFLMSVKAYLDNFSSSLPPILICDSFYLDKEDFYIKKKLNNIGKVGFVRSSSNQFFKNLDIIFGELSSLFSKKQELFYDLFSKCLDSLENIKEKTKLNFLRKDFYLPEFQRSYLPSEYKKYESNEDLFFGLIEKGFQEKFRGGEEVKEIWLNRLKEEFDVIKEGGFIDYFLILWDVIRFCKEKDILIGVGRGSAGGSLISYLLGITYINPLDYGLLFERFLNRGRIGKSLPDIDLDFEAKRRNDVKNYIESIYGKEHVCAVGTYTSFQLKQTIKDLSREENISFSDANIITSYFDYLDENWKDIFLKAIKIPSVKEFVISHPNLINSIPLILGQPKAASVHACALLILPNSYNGKEKTIYDWIPVRKDKEENFLVSEWEGEELSEVGFLKEDILGLLQLDKFKDILTLIKKNKNEEVDIYNLPLEDEKIFNLFKKGFTSDVFHFGSEGLRKMSMDIKPDSINELIAMIALIRPGGLQSGANEKYFKIKFGEEVPEYDFGLKEVTKDTFGLYIYQEQVMQAVQVLGGFSLTEADDIRKAMGRMKPELISSYRNLFLQRAIEKGCPKEEAEGIWEKLQRFAHYGFNKSHAAAYTLMGYICQWLKVHYPLEFWAVALQYVKRDDLISSFISEMRKLNREIKIVSPDINFSTDKFFIDSEENKIYWSLDRIKGIGGVSLEELLKEKKEGGEIFSFEEFYNRIKKNKRNISKDVLESLIFAGAFDKVEGISNIKERIKILTKYHSFYDKKSTIEELYSKEDINEEYWWELEQRLTLGIGNVDYRKLLEKTHLNYLKNYYIEGEKFPTTTTLEKKVLVAGIVLVQEERRSETKGPHILLKIDSNGEQIVCCVYLKKAAYQYREILINSKNKVIFVYAKIVENRWHKKRLLQTDETSKLIVI